MYPFSMLSKKAGSLVVDSISILSLIGIWPRYIEPKLLSTTYLNISDLTPKALTIVHLTDLHFHKGVSNKFLNKVTKKVNAEKPDLILFTGDFICCANLEEETRLAAFLNSLKAKMGHFCTFGNHDYDKYVTRARSGDYILSKPINPLVGFLRGLLTLFEKQKIGKVSPDVFHVKEHEKLISLLKKTPFTILENTSVTLPIGLNLVGLGDYALGRFRPDIAFKDYDHSYPGIVLSHNPDTFPSLVNYPGELVLCGHTHGEQVHFPLKSLRPLSQKLTRIENPDLTRGFYEREGKKLYVNRGIGCHKPLRLFSKPEILVIKVQP